MKNTAKNRIKARKNEKDYLVIGNMNCILNDILAELRKAESAKEQFGKELSAVNANEQDFAEEYIDEYGDLIRKNNKGQLHSLYSPAIQYSNGNKYWYKDGKLHREDGPAIEYANGYKAWYKDGKLYGSSNNGYTQEQFEEDLRKEKK